MLSTLGASQWTKNIQFSRFNAEGANNKLLWRKFTTDFTTPYNESAPGVLSLLSPGTRPMRAKTREID